MSYGRMLGIAGLGAMAVITSLVTSVAVGRFSGRAEAQVTQPARVPTLVHTRSVPGERLPEHGIRKSVTASFSLREHEVVAANGDAVIHMKARIRDIRPGSRYVWALDIKDDTGEQVLRTVYRDQIFFVADEGGTIEPVFNEVVPLEPGVYEVRVELLDVPNGFDLRRFDEGEVAEKYRLLMSLDKITL